ncbi:hypothetical protein [Amycolatopsis thermalba]|uniref:hypothetical protein n=1 Tax=Amycolatopsis thermalba TaxID=944492 RepID=UPI001ABF5DA2|nr:hypothetical protein [Amycolatopsis thermalba]
MVAGLVGVVAQAGQVVQDGHGVRGGQSGRVERQLDHRRGAQATAVGRGEELLPRHERERVDRGFRQRPAPVEVGEAAPVRLVGSRPQVPVDRRDGHRHGAAGERDGDAVADADAPVRREAVGQPHAGTAAAAEDLHVPVEPGAGDQVHGAAAQRRLLHQRGHRGGQPRHLGASAGQRPLTRVEQHRAGRCGVVEPQPRAHVCAGVGRAGVGDLALQTGIARGGQEQRDGGRGERDEERGRGHGHRDGGPAQQHPRRARPG